MVLDNSVDIDETSDAHVYVVGHTIRRVIKCPTCFGALSHAVTENDFIRLKKFKDCNLCDPLAEVVADFQKMKALVSSLLAQIPHFANISSTILQHSEVKVLFDFTFIHDSCRRQVQISLLKSFCSFLIRVFCTRTNEKLKNRQHQTLKKYKKIMQ